MSQNRSVFPIILALFGFLLLAGLGWVFALQFSGGTTIPEGSSLRADPGGTMILHDTLDRLPGLDVARHTDGFSRLSVNPGETTLVIPRASRGVLEDKDLEAFVREGGRVVASIPVAGPRTVFRGVKVTRSPFRERADARNVSSDPSDARAPERVAWEKRAVFDLQEASDTAEILYAVAEGPVVLRVTEEAGAWILLGWDGLLSNEAMYLERETEWLLWLLGGRPTLRFHEHHFGVATPRGTATLLREYRLGGVLAALGVSFLLLVWRGAFPLLPPLKIHEEPSRGVQSRLSGFRDLLARHIPGGEIPGHCVDAWEESFLRRPAEAERFQDLLAEARTECRRLSQKSSKTPPAKAYRHLHDILTRKRTRT